MLNQEKNKLILFYIVTTLVISLAFIPINSVAYDWNKTETVTLNEYDNVGYGALDGNRLRENQLLEAQYATDIRYVRETVGQRTDSMSNGSTVFRTNLANQYYDDYLRYDPEDSVWIHQPTYIQAYNNTGTGPNLQFTTGVNNKGTLSMNSETAIEMEPQTYYVFKVNLGDGEMYDLNLKSIASVNYYIYYNGYLSDSGSINGESRNIQPLAARDNGEYFIYLYSSSDNYVVFDPVKIAVSHTGAGDFIAGFFSNEPNNIWDEDRQVFVENKDSETVHAYMVRLSKGTYEFKYIRFDGSISTNAYALIPSLYYESGYNPGYIDYMIGSAADDKFIFSFEYDTKILVYITAERDNNDYVEFDYIFAVDKIDCPVLEPGVDYEYENNFLCFALDIKETQVAYINFSVAGPLVVWFLDYRDKHTLYADYYSLQDDGASAEKILLQPGYYFFIDPDEALYDFDLEYNAVIAESFANPVDFSMSQSDGSPTNYKLLQISNNDFNFHNYNISLTTQGNYTIEYDYGIYLSNNPTEYSSSSGYIGYQQVGGVYQGYPVNDYQMLNFMSTGEETTRYVLLQIVDIYNNTGYTWSNPGVVYAVPVSVNLQFKADNAIPEIYGNVNLNLIEANLATDGSGTVSDSFDTAINNNDVYFLHATVPELTWYRIEISIVNGSRDNTYYILKNSDGIFGGYTYRDTVWNRYYKLDSFYSTHYINYNTNGSDATFDVEFGTFDTNLIFAFGIDHTGLNGSVVFKFIPHSCTPISSVASILVKGLGLGGIIALSVVGGAIAVAGVAVLVVKVIIPKTKSSSSPSQF